MYTVGEVTAETQCPHALGRPLLHYPRLVDGTPVTMPYLDSARLQPTTVLLSLCRALPLLPPQASTDRHRLTCADCEHALRGISIPHNQQPNPTPDLPLHLATRA